MGTISDSKTEIEDLSVRREKTRKEIQELSAELENLITSRLTTVKNNLTIVNDRSLENLDSTNKQNEESPVVQCVLNDRLRLEEIKPLARDKLMPQTHAGITLRCGVGSYKETKAKHIPDNEPVKVFSKKSKSYDVKVARDYIKKQREKRTEELKAKVKETQANIDLKKEKLKQLHEKSLFLVSRNLQQKREFDRTQDVPTQQIRTRTNSVECIQQNRESRSTVQVAKQRSKSSDRIHFNKASNLLQHKDVSFKKSKENIILNKEKPSSVLSGLALHPSKSVKSKDKLNQVGPSTTIKNIEEVSVVKRVKGNDTESSGYKLEKSNKSNQKSLATRKKSESCTPVESTKVLGNTKTKILKSTLLDVPKPYLHNVRIPSDGKQSPKVKYEKESYPSSEIPAKKQNNKNHSSKKKTVDPVPVERKDTGVKKNSPINILPTDLINCKKVDCKTSNQFLNIPKPHLPNASILNDAKHNQCNPKVELEKGFYPVPQNHRDQEIHVACNSSEKSENSSEVFVKSSRKQLAEIAAKAITVRRLSNTHLEVIPHLINSVENVSNNGIETSKKTVDDANEKQKKIGSTVQGTKSEHLVMTNSCEKQTKDTQTNQDQLKRDVPNWLQPPNSLNFINTVKRKLKLAIGSHDNMKDVGTQISFVEPTSKIDNSDDLTKFKTKAEIKKIIENGMKTYTRQSEPEENKDKSSSRLIADNNNLKSFLSHKCLDLNLLSAVENLDLVEGLQKQQKIGNVRNKDRDLEPINSDTSDYDTSKNIPEISSESSSHEPKVSDGSVIETKSSCKTVDNLKIDVEKLKHFNLKKSNLSSNGNSSYTGKVKHLNMQSQYVVEDIQEFLMDQPHSITKADTTKINRNLEDNHINSAKAKSESSIETIIQSEIVLGNELSKTFDSQSARNKNKSVYSSKHSEIERNSKSAASKYTSYNSSKYSKSFLPESEKNSVTQDSVKASVASTLSKSTAVSVNNSKISSNRSNINLERNKLNDIISPKGITTSSSLHELQTLSDYSDNFIPEDEMSDLHSNKKTVSSNLEPDSTKESNKIKTSNSQSFKNIISKHSNENIPTDEIKTDTLETFQEIIKSETFTGSSNLKTNEKPKLNSQHNKNSVSVEALEKQSNLNIPPLKEPTASLQVDLSNNKNIVDKTALIKNISLRAGDTHSHQIESNKNEIHLKFEAEVHLLNDFNESLKQFMAVEKAFESLKQKNDLSSPRKFYQNIDTQTSAFAKTPTYSKITDESMQGDNTQNQISTINYSRGSEVEMDNLNEIPPDRNISKIADNTLMSITGFSGLELSNLNDTQDISVDESRHSLSVSNIENHSVSSISLKMFEQLIKDEDIRIENLKTIIKIREKSLLDRTRTELALLEIQRKHLKETGQLDKISDIKKKQRGIILKHQHERHEMQKLKQIQQAASRERKLILKEQSNLIKAQLSTNDMLSNIKVSTPRKKRQSGPLKVIQSHSETIRSETSMSRRSSVTDDVVSITSMSHRSVTSISEGVKPDLERTQSTHSVLDAIPMAQIRQTLLMREAVLRKRRKAAEELLKWHQKLLEEEKKIEKLESAANVVINQTPSANEPEKETKKYRFKGSQLNYLWQDMTGRNDNRFNDDVMYSMSQNGLEQFYKSARAAGRKNNMNRKIDKSSELTSFHKSGKDQSENNVSATIVSDIPQRQSSRNNSIQTDLISQVDVISELSDSIDNSYTSDFESDSVKISEQDAAQLEFNKISSISELIDNFSKIKEEISSLSRKTEKDILSLKDEENFASELDTISENRVSLPSQVNTIKSSDSTSSLSSVVSLTDIPKIIASRSLQTQSNEIQGKLGSRISEVVSDRRTQSTSGQSIEVTDSLKTDVPEKTLLSSSIKTSQIHSENSAQEIVDLSSSKRLEDISNKNDSLRSSRIDSIVDEQASLLLDKKDESRQAEIPVAEINENSFSNKISKSPEKDSDSVISSIENKLIESIEKSLKLASESAAAEDTKTTTSSISSNLKSASSKISSLEVKENVTDSDVKENIRQEREAISLKEEINSHEAKEQDESEEAGSTQSQNNASIITISTPRSKESSTKVSDTKSLLEETSAHQSPDIITEKVSYTGQAETSNITEEVKNEQLKHSTSVNQNFESQSEANVTNIETPESSETVSIESSPILEKQISLHELLTEHEDGTRKLQQDEKNIENNSQLEVNIGEFEEKLVSLSISDSVQSAATGNTSKSERPSRAISSIVSSKNNTKDYSEELSKEKQDDIERVKSESLEKHSELSNACSNTTSEIPDIVTESRNEEVDVQEISTKQDVTSSEIFNNLEIGVDENDELKSLNDEFKELASVTGASDQRKSSAEITSKQASEVDRKNVSVESIKVPSPNSQGYLEVKSTEVIIEKEEIETEDSNLNSVTIHSETKIIEYKQVKENVESSLETNKTETASKPDVPNEISKDFNILSSKIDTNNEEKSINNEEQAESITEEISVPPEEKEHCESLIGDPNRKEDVHESKLEIDSSERSISSEVTQRSSKKDDSTKTTTSQENTSITNEGILVSTIEAVSGSTVSTGSTENTSEKSSIDKSPSRGKHIDVKKRVSEILADVNQLSRGDKSPRLQDLYMTTYDLLSPANSPESGSPEHKKFVADSIFGDEAKQLMMKQLAIEQEIKQLEQQQKEAIPPYVYMREIPNKPPPPYTPPASQTAVTVLPADAKDIQEVVHYAANVLHKAYLSNNLANVKLKQCNFKLVSTRNIGKHCCEFMFDLCTEMAVNHYKQFEKPTGPTWLRVERKQQMTSVKPYGAQGLERYMSKKLKELFGFQKVDMKESAIIKWSRKKRDHVDEILVIESQSEESEWINYDHDELLVKDEITNDLMNMLLSETADIFNKLLDKKAILQ